MPGYDPDRHAQASEPALTCLPLGTQEGTHRRRRESEGHFLGDKGFTEQEVTFAFAVAPAPYPKKKMGDRVAIAQETLLQGLGRPPSGERQGSRAIRRTPARA